MKKKSTADLKKWCELLVIQQPMEDIPDGWSTCVQLADELNQSRSYVGRRLNERVKDGSCEMRTFRTKSGNVVRPIPHYRIK